MVLTLTFLFGFTKGKRRERKETPLVWSMNDSYVEYYVCDLGIYIYLSVYIFIQGRVNVYGSHDSSFFPEILLLGDEIRGIDKCR